MRQLLYVPIIHTESDLGSAAAVLDKESAAWCGEERWAKHKETVARFWERLADYFANVEAANLKIYQDGLPADGEPGRRIVEEAARRGSRNHQIVLDLMARGAAIRKTEDPALLKEEYENITGVTRSRTAADKTAAYTSYKARQNQLTKARDRFIARAIAETLKEGETGVLFMGSYHNILPYLPRDIAVQPVKERQKVNAYFKALVSRTGDNRLEPLAQYLASPGA